MWEQTQLHTHKPIVQLTLCVQLYGCGKQFVGFYFSLPVFHQQMVPVCLRLNWAS